MLNILIVEDDEQTLQLCSDALSAMENDLNPIPAASAEAALEILKTSAIDGAFIDIILPGMDGFALANRIRDIDDYYFLPIIFETGEDKNLPDTYKEYRNIDYISKPFNMEMFRSVASRLVAEIEKQRTLSIKKGMRQIPFLYDGGRALITFSEILYATIIPERRIKLVTRDHTYNKSNVTLNNIITEINEEMFVRCHKAYVVNLDNIERIERFSRKAWTIYFKDAPGETCEMSQKFRISIEALLASHGF